MMRGIERRAIFLDRRDREDFNERLCERLPAEGMRCLGWALMPNHVHLLVQTGPAEPTREHPRMGFEELVTQVASHFGLERFELQGGGQRPTVSRARAAL